MKHIVVGTAGHIDHGKTSLIMALTGRETDTLEEEKKRGISINLGFTYFDLPSGKRVGIVDVPGHEKFIKNMLAGASGLDMVVLVVAADEGMMPQTIEHIDILSYLKIKKGLVVMTKCDMVDDEMLELAEDDIKEGLKGTFLDGVEVLRVDSLSKRGIPELISKLDEMSEEVEEKNTMLPPRLNIDRVFSIKGFGTVVTGTIIEGIIKVNDELEIYPSHKKVVVRNIQVHSENVDVAYAGQRTAINLSNVKVNDIERGDILAASDSMLESMMLDVKIKLLNHEGCKLENWDRLKLYHGTKEILCRAVPLEIENMKAGDEGFVQLRLEEKIVCKKMDPFVIRTYSPMDTIGGGVIVDVSNVKHSINKDIKKILEDLKIKESGDEKLILDIYLKNNSYKFPKIQDMMAYVGVDKTRIENLLSELSSENKTIEINGKIVHEEYYRLLKSKLLRILKKYHDENNLRLGMPKQEAGTKVESSFKIKDIDAFLDLVQADGEIKAIDNTVSLFDFKVELNEEEISIKNQILSELNQNGYEEISTIEDICKNDKKKKSVLDSMIGAEIELLDDENIVATELYEKAKEKLIDYINKNGEISLGEFRDMMNSSRKISMLILESFDKKKITKRVENKRILY
ncbi:MAG: selenocysteine-specific translation elongation factor [Peptostreptococcus porci]|uniref:selenocysteine-specific translation elongation factor n=1 Tax=Peptostreptococcus porci TaxID=2652282 RepID=UPI0023F3314B|nr:selenocysteine-specific translation elongation factor [Peptostreptococcus porci]MDD7183404.1 selenocysteine-specific translation elongation factor [Peptostreptococcus porci]MDY5479096.1 selenocysteine-specific translation elongation factor [Peptostreptococcus porci]